MMNLKTLLASAVLCPSLAAAQTATVPAKIACAECSIELTPIVRLLAPASTATSFTPSSRVVRAQNGKYYVAPLVSAGVMVFDAAGRFVRVIATRAGKGPGEIGSADRALQIFPGKADTVVIYDPANSRKSMFLASGEFVGSVQVPVSSSYMPLMNGGLAFVRLPPDPAKPFHITNADGAVVKSFGPTDPSRPPRAEVAPSLAPSHDGSFWSNDILRFAADHWAADGTLLHSVVQSPSWFRPFDFQNPAPRVDAVVDVTGVSEGLWMLIRDYRDVEPDSLTSTGAAPRSELIRMFDSVLQLIDVTRNEIVSQRRFDPILHGFVLDPLDHTRSRQIFRVVDLPDGDLAIDLLDITLKRR